MQPDARTDLAAGLSRALPIEWRRGRLCFELREKTNLMLYLVGRTALVLWLLLNGLGNQPQADSVVLKLSLISAKQQFGPIDPALKRISKRLKRAFIGYRSFQQVANLKLTLSLRRPKQLTLPGGKTASLTYLGEQRGKFRLKVSFPKFDMILKMRRKRVSFVTEPGSLRGQSRRLVIAVMLR